MLNQKVAGILAEIADLLDLEGVPFKPRAYRRAAQVIEALGEPIEDLVAAGSHQELPGVGDAIAKKIAEIVQTGHLAYYEELKKKLPIDLHGLTQVEGVGPKTAKRLYDALGVRTLEDLATAAREGKIEEVAGLGAKTQEKILRGLSETQAAAGRTLLGVALSLAEGLEERLRSTGLFGRLATAGSLRRARETIGDLDLLATSEAPSRAAESFVRLSDVREVLAHGSKKASVRLDSGMQVDLRLVPEESFGAALQYFTGSKAHNIALRKRAVAKGWKLNEYGLTDEDGGQVAGVNEEGIYRALGLAFIPPELREDDGEIQAAERNEIPTLVELADLHGDLHVHTEASDGQASLAEMVAAARQRGLEHIAITDHARFAEVIGGLTPDGIRRQIDEIAALNETLKGFRVLTGIEANIQADGSLDVEDGLLKRLDVVIASLHGQFRQTEQQMTERLLRVCRNEHVDIVGHPTGRKIGERRPVAADWDAVFEAAAESGTAMEVNANPIRLDLGANLVRRAIDAGCRIAIGSDAHKPEHFDYLRLGILTARRGWARAEDLLTVRDS